MLTKERIGKTRKLKYAAVALALLAVLVFCFASCGKATPTGIEYVAGTAAKVEYNPGETFDCTGAQVKVTYDNNASETVAVTPEMVGNAPLTLGTESVSVTYSENGATVVGHIPVTVVDPNAKLKAETVAQLSLNKDVVANSADAGVALLVNDYAAQIKTAASKEAVASLVAGFEKDLADYLGKKADIIAKFDADALTAKITQLYAQFKTDIFSAKATAIANVKAASTLDEANDYLAAFTVAVDNKLAEQKVYEDKGEEGEDKGQIYDKIALLEDLEAYEAEIADFKRIVDAGNAEKEAETLAYYDGVLKDISREKKYITLAIDLGSIDLEATIGSQLINEIDEAVELILEADKITIYPRAYVEGALEEDAVTATRTLLDKVKAKFTAAAAKFGADGIEELKARYGQPATATTFADNYINILLDMIETKYDELNAIRMAAEGYEWQLDAVTGEYGWVEVNDSITELIDAIPAGSTGEPGDAHDMAIRAAWRAIKEWNAAINAVSGEANAVVTAEDSDGSSVLRITYDKNFAGVIYTATGFDAKTQKWTTVDETWDAYTDTVDETYVVTYFIPNLNDLIVASQARYAKQVQELIYNEKLDLDNIYYSTDADVDSGAEINAAREAYTAFTGAYSTEVYNKYFLDGAGADLFLTRLEDAETKYGDLKAKAETANLLIGAYRDLIKDKDDTAPINVANIVVAHYMDGGALKKAYDAYLEFADANGALEHAGETAYTDKITYEARLLAYMDHYTAMVAYIDAKDVDSAKTIMDAWKVRDDAAKAHAVAPPTFRADLELFATEMVNYIQREYSYNALPTDLVVEGVAVNADNAKFYYNNILADNVADVVDAAEIVANYIEGFVYDDDDTDGTYYDASDLVNPLLGI